MLVRRVGICLQLRESQSSTATNPSDHLYRTQSIRTPPPAQRRQKEKEGTGGWLVRMIVVVDTGRISKLREVDSACGRPLAIGWKLRSETLITAPTVIEDYGSPHPRLFTSKSLRACHVNVLGHRESFKGSGSSSMGWESEGNSASCRWSTIKTPWLIQPRVAAPQLERDSTGLSMT